MDYNIAVILPNTPTCTTMRRILDEMNLDYPVIRESGHEALEEARNCINKGTQVIISAGLTRDIIADGVDIPVMDLPFSGLEAANAIRQALTFSNRIIHLGTPSLYKYISNALEIMERNPEDVHFKELTKDRSIEEQAIEVITEGYDVIIGGYTATKVAQLYGKHGIEVDVDELVIKVTINGAISFLNNIESLKYQTSLLDTILQSTKESIVLVDENRNILMMNENARNLLSHNAEGLNIDNLMRDRLVVNIDRISIDQIDPEANYEPVIYTEHPITLSDNTQGTVINMEKIPEFEKMNYKNRKELYAQGLWAEYTFKSILGESRAMNLAKEKTMVYAKYNSPVLLTGETGTGKEIFAQSIHNASRRKMCPWVPVNCAALPESLIESELFGYEPGAFTGAGKNGKAGFFELADGGTIFLDEISELPINIQSKLLRVIQEGDVIRVGSNKIKHVDVRVICSSNKDLLQLISQKKFKEDLYYRLNVLEIQLPPLRERREDIIELAENFLKKFNEKHDKKIKGFTSDAMTKIMNLPLPGNVRELQNMVERMVIFEDDEYVSEQTFLDVVETSMKQTLYSPFTAPSESAAEASTPSAPQISSGNLKDMQKEIIIAALERNGGNKAATARELGIDPSTLWRRLKKYNITV